jgi:hypothetical protein
MGGGKWSTSRRPLEHGEEEKGVDMAVEEDRGACGAIL